MPLPVARSHARKYSCTSRLFGQQRNFVAGFAVSTSGQHRVAAQAVQRSSVPPGLRINSTRRSARGSGSECGCPAQTHNALARNASAVLSAALSWQRRSTKPDQTSVKFLHCSCKIKLCPRFCTINLTNHFLIAMPPWTMRYFQSVVYVCEHTEHGALAGDQAGRHEDGRPV